MKRSSFGIGIALVALLAAGVWLAVSPRAQGQRGDEANFDTLLRSNRWTIEQVEMFVPAVVAPDKTVVTILLDSASGDTWLLWPNADDEKFSWVPMARPEP